MPIVVVESPAKAKTIEKFLGRDYRVLATFGHIRDLKPKSGSVDPTDDFAMKWEVDKAALSRIGAIAKALTPGQELLLATDPDREGEAISWHLREILRRRRGLGGIASNAKRIVFNSITKSSVQNAIASPRQVDSALVDAYSARRALDYLVGFNLSPILWKKLPCARSAGRVQSVCLRLIVERELEIERFRAREFWTVDADLETAAKEQFRARLRVLNGKKLAKHDLATKDAAEQAAEAIKRATLAVLDLQTKDQSRRPQPPFTTATLQQEASRKLRFNTKSTMMVAQKLYEAGHITYMRTDAIDMAPEAVKAARGLIRRQFGTQYCPQRPRIFKNKAKNAQEAHECIRPTDFAASAATLGSVSRDQRNLYQLVWNRAVASQMANARFKRTQVEIANRDSSIMLQANGSVRVFDGFLKIYEEGQDKKAEDASQDIENALLPALAIGEGLAQRKIIPVQHFTKPKPRYTEASLIKKMVELGIGRPSTYSSIVSRIQEHGYTQRVERSRTLQPTPTGRVLNAFLTHYFAKYIEYDFTAELEEQLDDISGGRKARSEVLESFWLPFSQSVNVARDLQFTDVADRLSGTIAPQFLEAGEDGMDVRHCPNCSKGTLVLKFFRNSDPYFRCDGCSFNLPLQQGAKGFESQNKLLGNDPESNRLVHLKVGKFGHYIEMAKSAKPRRSAKTVSWPKQFSLDEANLDLALQLLALPRHVGDHPDGRGAITAGIGRNGPYVRCEGLFASVPDAREVLNLGMNRAVELLANAGRGGGNFRDLGEHPKEGGPVRVLKGRYGPYIKYSGGNVSIPAKIHPESLSLEQALVLIENKKQGRSRGSRSQEVRTLGEHPAKGSEVKLMKGPYGPYVKWKRTNAKLPPNLANLDDVTLDDAVKLIERRLGGRAVGSRSNVIREIGEHPKLGGPIQVIKGRNGPSLKWRRRYAPLPKDVDPKDLTPGMAVALMNRKSKGAK